MFNLYEHVDEILRYSTFKVDSQTLRILHFDMNMFLRVQNPNLPSSF